MIASKRNSSTGVYLLILLILLTGCFEGEVGYQPPGVPLKVSVTSKGRVTFSTESSFPTPLGTFSVGVVADPAKYFETEQTLTVRFNGKDHFYALDEGDFDIEFESGYYEKVRLVKSASNIMLELRRVEQVVSSENNGPIHDDSPSSDYETSSEPLLSTSIPTSAPTRCDVEINPEFYALWKRAGGVAAGCPLGAAYERRVASQHFESGFMIWRASSHGDAGGMIYVAYNSGSWQEYRDEWHEGMPESGGYQPPSGSYEPIRGFGYLWRKLGGPDADIGWAVKPEQGSDFGLLQDFGNNAVIVRAPHAITVFFPDSKYWVD